VPHNDPRNLELDHTSEGAVHAHHGPSIRTYVFVWIGLLIGTGLTVFAASYNLGALSAPIALLIATLKALLVVLFFMELKYSTKMTVTVIIAAIFFFFILLSLTMIDYVSRSWNTFG